MVATCIATTLEKRRLLPADASEAWRARWANARVERLTDFPGSEVDAAISTDGQYVAFLARRIIGRSLMHRQHGRVRKGLRIEPSRFFGFAGAATACPYR